MNRNTHLPPDLDAEAADLLRGGSLPFAFGEHWRSDPVRRVLRDVDGHWLTGGELDERTAAGAARLAGAGLGAGDRLILCGPASAALVIAYVAALRAGLVVVPVNPGYPRPEVERIVGAASPAAAAIADPERAAWVHERASTPITGLDLDGLPGEPSAAPPDAAGAEDPALLMYTSGTTGAPKGALLSHGNLLAGARAVATAWRWTPEDRLLLALPLFHMHGLGVGINGGLVAGGQIVLRPGFDPADVAGRCRDGGPSMFFGVPTMYERLLASGQADALGSLRLIVSGSAPLPAAQSDAVAQAAGQRPLERYGMTETVMITSNPLDGPRKPGKVGLPLPGVELRLHPTSQEVQVRGPSVIAGYDRAHGDAESFTEDGWFRTGDIGERDADGHLQLVGRRKELIISGGFNVHPREVEEVLAGFPGVKEVAVVGRPSPAWGEAVTAVVVADHPVDPQALRAFAAESLAPYKVPKAIEFADALPRNALGKLIRRKL